MSPNSVCSMPSLCEEWSWQCFLCAFFTLTWPVQSASGWLGSYRVSKVVGTAGAWEGWRACLLSQAALSSSLAAWVICWKTGTGLWWLSCIERSRLSASRNIWV
eukprot:CAMPEP_0173170780 /NCGR_PEP_ID=MMETSP1141-20130122/1409_1 /TAXON_ID=483371 /ORGANISM="non described non described, Strain CCMP2298" /LENGTH=103 /DNA_ID=CAMNT_0014092675 /DNA_START=253 /DNA_END=564 /DNA_ORIENTATION=+